MNGTLLQYIIGQRKLSFFVHLKYSNRLLQLTDF
uniref:Uncharacterized protein n=1 Tax=Anguilla anguilla TaxID=7936 RepID=A0A0E9QJW2_ANGAN